MLRQTSDFPPDDQVNGSITGRDAPSAGKIEADEMSRQEEDAELDTLREQNARLHAQVTAQAWEINLLRARFARYEGALRGSHVIVYTQDSDLRYTSINAPMLGRAVEDILGRTDAEILPVDTGTALTALKREALATGQAKRTELSIDDAPGLRWYDMHIEPLNNDAGDVIGLTCAAIDVTERKEAEAHLRLLLRELTHRSKNLLAVIQGMARQTARHAGSTDSFLTQFGARLQALAASHDILVRESWYGASLDELVRSQLTAYIDTHETQVRFAGPSVTLKPEAAQNLGLALHELTANAARYGALSMPGGKVVVEWRREASDSQALILDWREEAGPKVKMRRKKGFGSMVIEHNLARSLDAEVSLEFYPDGLRCHVVIPASQILVRA